MASAPNLRELVPIDGGLIASWDVYPYAPISNVYLLVTNLLTNEIKSIPLDEEEAADEMYTITGLDNGTQYGVQFVQVDDVPSGTQLYSNTQNGIPAGKPAAPRLVRLTVSPNQLSFTAVVKFASNNGGALTELDFAIFDETEGVNAYLSPISKNVFNPSDVNNKPPVEGEERSYVLALPAGQTLVTNHYYIVSCLVRNLAGNSLMSNSIAEKLALNYSPKAPELLTVQSGENGKVTVNFKQGQQVSGYPDLEYNISAWLIGQSLTASAQTSMTITAVPGQSTYTATLATLNNAVAYQLAVRAKNAWSSAPDSAWSNVITAVPYIPAAFPANPITMTPSSNSMTVTWLAATGTFAVAPPGVTSGGYPANNYVYELSAPGQQTVTGTTIDNNRTATFKDLVSGVTYAFGVTAIQTIPPTLSMYTVPMVSQSVTFASATQKLALVPSAPQNLLALTDTANTEQLVWELPSSDGGSPIKGYYLEAWTSSPPANILPPNVTYSTIPTYSPTQSALVRQQWVTSTQYNAIITGLTENVGYYFRAFSANDVGLSAPSAVVGPAYPSEGLPEPTDATAVIQTVTGSTIPIKVSWSSVTNIVGGPAQISSFDVWRISPIGVYSLVRTVPYAPTPVGMAYSIIVEVDSAPNVPYQYAVQAVGTFNNGVTTVSAKSAFDITNVVSTATAPTISNFAINPVGQTGIVTFSVNNNGSPIIAGGVMLFAPATPSYSGVEPDPVNLIPINNNDPTGVNSYTYTIPYAVNSQVSQPYLLSVANAIGVDYEYSNLSQ